MVKTSAQPSVGTPRPTLPLGSAGFQGLWPVNGLASSNCDESKRIDRLDSARRASPDLTAPHRLDSSSHPRTDLAALHRLGSPALVFYKKILVAPTLHVPPLHSHSAPHPTDSARLRLSGLATPHLIDYARLPSPDLTTITPTRLRSPFLVRPRQSRPGPLDSSAFVSASQSTGRA